MKKYISLLVLLLITLSFVTYSQDNIKDPNLISKIINRLENKSTDENVRKSCKALRLTTNYFKDIEIKIVKAIEIEKLEVLDNSASGRQNLKFTISKADINPEILSDYYYYLINDFSLGYKEPEIKAQNDLLNIINNLIPTYKSMDKERWVVDDRDIVKNILIEYEKQKSLFIFGVPVKGEYITKIKNKNLVVVITKLPESQNIERLGFYLQEEISDASIPDSLRFPLFDESVHSSVIVKKFDKANEYYKIVTNQERWPPVVEYSGENYKNFNLRIALFDPELKFINFGWDAEASIFAKWGYDNIPILGWYTDDIIAGFKYEDYGLPITGKIGMVLNTKRPWVNLDPKVPFYNSGTAIYWSLEGKFVPFSAIISLFDPESGDKFNKYTQTSIESKISLNNRKTSTYRDILPGDFYSFRTYINTEFKWMLPYEAAKNIQPFRGFNIGDLQLAVGITLADVRLFNLDFAQKEVKSLEDEKVNKFKHFAAMPFIKVSFVKSEGFVSHKFDLFLNRNFAESYSYIGATLELMLFHDIIGVQAKVMAGFDKDKLPVWSKDIYATVSPILKIKF